MSSSSTLEPLGQLATSRIVLPMASLLEEDGTTSPPLALEGLPAAAPQQPIRSPSAAPDPAPVLLLLWSSSGPPPPPVLLLLLLGAAQPAWRRRRSPPAIRLIVVYFFRYFFVSVPAQPLGHSLASFACPLARPLGRSIRSTSSACPLSRSLGRLLAVSLAHPLAGSSLAVRLLAVHPCPPSPPFGSPGGSARCPSSSCHLVDCCVRACPSA